MNPIDDTRFCFKPFDGSGAFISTPQGQGIRRLAVRGAGSTVVAQAAGLSIQMISGLILARLLTPSDFGLVAMVTVFSLLLMNAGLNGFTEALLQRKDVDHFLASNIFWINLSTGLTFTIVFGVAGSLIAWFYNNPKVAPIVLGLSVTIVITSASVVHLALLMRAMRFPITYGNQIFARLVSVIVAILLAWGGWEYWALVGGAVAQPLSECIGAWSLCRWVPGRPRRIAGTGSMVRFAINVYLRFSFNYFARNLDNLLIGWRFNAQSLGFYRKAYDLFLMSSAVQAFTPVAVSTLSRMSHDLPQYKRHLLAVLSVGAFCGMGVGGALTLAGRDLVRVLLGPGWETTGEIFTFFGPSIGFMFIYGIHSWIHLSIGRPDRWLRWGIIEFLVTGLLIIVALPWGPIGIATSKSLSLLLLTMPALWYAGRPISFEIVPLFGAIWKFVLAAILAGFLTAMITGVFTSVPSPLGLTEAVIHILKLWFVFGALYVVAVLLLHRSFRPLYQVGDLLKEIVPSGMFSKPVAVKEPVTVARQE